MKDTIFSDPAYAKWVMQEIDIAYAQSIRQRTNGESPKVDVRHITLDEARAATDGTGWKSEGGTLIGSGVYDFMLRPEGSRAGGNLEAHLLVALRSENRMPHAVRENLEPVNEAGTRAGSNPISPATTLDVPELSNGDTVHVAFPLKGGDYGSAELGVRVEGNQAWLEPTPLAACGVVEGRNPRTLGAMVEGDRPSGTGTGHPSDGQTIGWAVNALHSGARVRRAGWNGKGMHLELQVPDEHSKMERPYVFIKPPYGADGYESGGLVPWICSQTDLLADDWELADDA